MSLDRIKKLLNESESSGKDECLKKLGFKKYSEEEINPDPKQLKMGIQVEKEHTTNKEVAKLIALAHLSEIPDYYTRLKKMESGAGVNENINESENDEFFNELFRFVEENKQNRDILSGLVTAYQLLEDYADDLNFGTVHAIVEYLKKIK